MVIHSELIRVKNPVFVLYSREEKGTSPTNHLLVAVAVMLIVQDIRNVVMVDLGDQNFVQHHAKRHSPASSVDSSYQLQTGVV